MRALTVTGIVGPDQVMRLQVPADIPCGPHLVVVVLDASPSSPPPATSEWSLPLHDVGPWPAGFTVRREDIYGDDGR